MHLSNPHYSDFTSFRDTEYITVSAGIGLAGIKDSG